VASKLLDYKKTMQDEVLKKVDGLKNQWENGFDK
jgi:hypothetical protein